MAKFALVRHGESKWNKIGLWTGWQDIALTDAGILEAKRAALVVSDISFHISFTSDLKRAIETLEIIKKELKIIGIKTVSHPALKERHYGEFTGKNKWEIKELVGEEEFGKIRRGWEEPIAGGETLKDVFQRVVPYFSKNILPHLKSGKNILLVAHGNSIRALIKHIESVSDEDISGIELETGEVVIYEINKKGKMLSMEKRRK